MKELLWLIPALPFAGALILILFGTKLSRTVVSIIGAGSVGVSAVLTILVGLDFLSTASGNNPFVQIAWTWINITGYTIDFGFHLDALSLVFLFVITFVGFLIHIYSTEFMAEDDGFSRFFAFLNLFV